MIASSANSLIFEPVTDIGMSFMKVRNNKGPRTVPCGTPEHKGNGFLVYYNSLFAICQERFYPYTIRAIP